MQPIFDAALTAEQMLLAQDILDSFECGSMPMHPLGYREVARWTLGTFASMRTAALKGLRDVAPAQLRCLIENVLHQRRTADWSGERAIAPAALAQCQALIERCRHAP